MKYNQQQKKMTYEMKSVGDAWMDHVQKHHNADAVTPEYLKPTEKKVEEPFLHENISKLKQAAVMNKVHESAVIKRTDKSLPSK